MYCDVFWRCVVSHAVKFDSDSHFTMETFYELEYIGIIPLRELEAFKGSLQSVVGMNEDLSIENSWSLLEMWVKGHASLHPTWRHFFWVLREINLNHLANQIEAFLSGVAVEQAAISNLDTVIPGSLEKEEREEDNKQEQGEYHKFLHKPL